MRIITIVTSFVVSLFFMFSGVAQAQNKLPLFVGGENKVITKTIEQDLMTAGGKIRIESQINGDAYVAGGQIEVDGAIDQDLIVVGGDVLVSGTIGKNLIVGGGKIKINNGSTIGGYLLIAGGEVEIDGQLKGTAKVLGGKLKLGENANVGGDLIADVGESIISEGAMIAGNKVINLHEIKSDEQNSQNSINRAKGVGYIIGFLSRVVIIMLLVRVFGKYLINTERWFNNPLSTLGAGTVLVLLTPVVLLLLMMTVIGIPLALILLGLFVIAIYTSWLVSAVAVGNFLAIKGWLNTNNRYWLSLAGLITITLAGWAPFVGWLVKLILFLLGMGMIYRLITTKVVQKTKQK